METMGKSLAAREVKLGLSFPTKASGILKLRQSFRVVLGGAKGLGLYSPTLFSDWVQAAPGSGCELGQSDSLQPGEWILVLIDYRLIYCTKQ